MLKATQRLAENSVDTLRKTPKMALKEKFLEICLQGLLQSLTEHQIDRLQ